MWYSRETEEVIEAFHCINSVSNVTIRHHSNCSIYYHIQCGPVIYVHLLLLLLITDHSDDIANALNGTSHVHHGCRCDNMTIQAAKLTRWLPTIQ